MKLLLYLIVIFISYGSLYPFNFSEAELDGEALKQLIHTWDIYTRGNILANIVLFIPFGLVGTLAIVSEWQRALTITAVLALGLMLSVALQIGQLYLPSRFPSMSDVIFNLIGTGIGTIAPSFLRWPKGIFKINLEDYGRLPLLLLGSWFAYRLMPFVPSLDWQELKNSLRPLLVYPDLKAINIFHDAVAWITACCLFYLAFRNHYPVVYLAIAALVAFGLEMVVVDNVVTLSNVIGAAIAFVLWWSMFSRLRRPATPLVLILAAMLVISGLAPFQQAVLPGTFHWLPFHGFLGGSMLVNTSVLFEKFFLYGALIWLLRQALSRLWLATLLTAVLVLCIEIVQTRFAFHTAEITDPLLALLIGITISVFAGKQRLLEEINPLMPEYPVGQPDLYSVEILPNSQFLVHQLSAVGIVVDSLPLQIGRRSVRSESELCDTNRIDLTDHKPYQLSRAHFVIERSGDGIVIRDSGSTLGTVVNGVKIGKYSRDNVASLRLGENDVVAGQPDSKFRFRLLVNVREDI